MNYEFHILLLILKTEYKYLVEEEKKSRETIVVRVNRNVCTYCL
jgi:hypothetical protein